MTIDEAIAKHRKIAETQKTLYDACVLKECNKHFLQKAAEHEQLAEWLEELKAIKDGSTPIIHGKAELELHDKAIRNKAIDDFVKFASDMPTVDEEDGTIRPMWLEEMAEKLKAGGENV